MPSVRGCSWLRQKHAFCVSRSRERGGSVLRPILYIGLGVRLGEKHQQVFHGRERAYRQVSNMLHMLSREAMVGLMAQHFP